MFRAVHETGAEVHFVDEPLAICYFEENRPSISTTNQWRYSYDWIERIRPLVTPRAYAAFLLTLVTALAARSGEYRACWTLLKEALRKGRPAAIDLFLFCGMVAIPQVHRRRLRRLFSF